MKLQATDNPSLIGANVHGVRFYPLDIPKPPVKEAKLENVEQPVTSPVTRPVTID